MTQNLLELAGIGRDRLHLYWCSSAEAQRFAEIATEVTESITAQGPFDPGAFPLELEAVEDTLDGEPLRWLVGKEYKIISKGDVYGRPWDQDTYEKTLHSVLTREYHKNLICQAIKAGHTAPREIGDKTGLDLKRISYLLADLEKTSRVEFKGMEDRKPVFATL
jgi:hypothetical protein